MNNQTVTPNDNGLVTATVAPEPDEPAAEVFDLPALQELSPASGFVGALATTLAEPRVTCWQWNAEDLER